MESSATKPIPFYKSRLFPLLVVNFIGALGYSIILPFMVFLVQGFGGEAVLYGILAAVYPAFQLVGAPLLGKWSDAVGRKKVLLVSQAGTLLSWLIFLAAFFVPLKLVFSWATEAFGAISLTVPLLVLFFARALDGLTGGNIAVANAYLSDISNEADRKVNFGKMSAAMNLGFIIGPALSGLMASLPSGKMLTVGLSAIISLIGLLLIIFYLPEVRAKEVEGCEEENLKKSLDIEQADCFESEMQSEGNIMVKPIARLMVGLYFFIFLGYNLFYSTFPIFTAGTLEWSPTQLGLFFTVLSSIMILVQGPLLGRYGDKFTEGFLFWSGCFAMMACFYLLSFGSLTAVYGSAVLFGVGNGIMWPSFMSMLAKVGSSKQQGGLQGIASSAGSLASIVGLVAGGFIFGLLGGSIYYLSAIIMGAIGTLGLLLNKRGYKVFG